MNLRQMKMSGLESDQVAYLGANATDDLCLDWLETKPLAMASSRRIFRSWT